MQAQVFRLVILLATLGGARAFNRGDIIASNPNLYCQREARERTPIHAVCNGLCIPRNGSHLFSITVDRDIYQGQPITVQIRSLTGTPLLGFAAIGYEINEQGVASVQGRIAAGDQHVVFQCPRDNNADTVVHRDSNPRRRNETLTWSSNINVGTIRFRSWITVRQNEIYMIESAPVRFTSEPRVNNTAVSRVFSDIMRLLDNNTRSRPSLQEFQTSFLDRLNAGFDLLRPFDLADSIDWVMDQFFPNGRSSRGSLPSREPGFPSRTGRIPLSQMNGFPVPGAPFNPMMVNGNPPGLGVQIQNIPGFGVNQVPGGLNQFGVQTGFNPQQGFGLPTGVGTQLGAGGLANTAGAQFGGTPGAGAFVGIPGIGVQGAGAFGGIPGAGVQGAGAFGGIPGAVVQGAGGFGGIPGTGVQGAGAFGGIPGVGVQGAGGFGGIPGAGVQGAGGFGGGTGGVANVAGVAATPVGTPNRNTPSIFSMFG